ncbi:MAG: TonB-dependent receptor [Bacteroidetes bacterium]|nr:TonB-dependent receptor [Bacteroidota bacterium]
MKRFLIIIAACFFIQQSLWSQNVSKDSVVKTIHLEEVSICDESSDKNESFSFYRNSKLANTEDILSRMQGVNLIKRGAYGLEPTLRSFSTGQTNLTIDGMRMYGACTDKMDPVSIYIEPVNLKSIQVTNGAAGALEGSTIGGQIEMHLKEPGLTCQKQSSGQISQAYSTVNNGSNSSAIWQQSSNKLAYRVSGTFRKADNYKAGSSKLIPNSGYQKANTSAALLFKVNTSQIIKLDYLGDWGKNIGYPALAMDVGTASAQIIAFTHRFTFSEKFLQRNELKIYYNDIIHQMDDTHRSDSPMHMDMPGWSSTVGFYNELTGAKNFKIRLDFHRAYTRADMTMYPVGEPIMYMQTLPENNINDMGLAIGRTFYLNKKQQININGRLDYFTQVAIFGAGSKQWKVFNTDITETQNNLLKNINISYVKQFKASTHIQMNFGYGERIPTSNERYGFYLFNKQDQFDYVGNLKLKPEGNYQAELIFKQQYKKIEYSVNLFYNHIQNYIYAYRLKSYSQMTIGAFGLKTYKNIEHAVSEGFEGTVKVQLLQGFSYIGSVKYVYSQTYNGLPLPLIPPFKLQQALRYNFKLYQFQFEHDYAMTQERINLDYGDRVTPSFHVFNVRASKNIRIKSSVLQITLACENILDTNYREHLDIGSIPRFGRNFLISLSYIF